MKDKRIAQKTENVIDDMENLRKNYSEWRNIQRKQKAPFFIIYKEFLENDKLKDINPTALKVYIYLGMYSNNETGECWHSVQTMADYFGMDKRTINRALENLIDIGLIERIQKGFKRVSNTFLKPY